MYLPVVLDLWGMATAPLRSKVASGAAPERVADFEYLLQLVAAGELRVVIDQVYELADAAQAHAHVDTGHKGRQRHPSAIKRRTAHGLLRGVVYADEMSIIHGMADRALQEPTFLIMTSLASGPQHGYAVLMDIEQISDGRVKLRAGTLYAALDRLRSDGLVAVDHEEVVDGRLRRYYRLTDAGAARLTAEAERAAQNARAATRRLGAPRPAGARVAGDPA